MKALNQAERNNLYLKFSLLFLLTVGLTVMAIFFDFTMPAELTYAQREKLKSYNTFSSNQKKIVSQIDTLSEQIDRLGNSNDLNLTIATEEIIKQINFTTISTDTSKSGIYVSLNSAFKKFLNARLKALENLENYKKCVGEKDELEAKISELKDELKDARDENRMQGNGG